ncbi:MAG: zinc-binding dehydrogenase, partial [Candidatus Bathyarchaeia archaeon]
HAQFLRVPFADMGLHKIPEGLEDEDVLAVSDILSTATYAAELAEVSPGDHVAIFGVGPVGLCTTAMCKTFGAGKIFAVDIAENRLSVAKELGADILINPKVKPPVPAIKKETDGRGVDAAVEAVGSKETLQYALEAVRGCGRVAIIGIFSEPQTVPVDLIQLKSLTVRSGYVDTNRIPKLIRLVQQRKINTRKLFTHTFPLSDALKAYELFDKGLDGVIKVAIKP